MNLVNPRLPPCSSRRDESVATKTPQSESGRSRTHLRKFCLFAREVHAPPLEYPPSPPVSSTVTAGDRHRRFSQIDFWSKFDRVDFDQRIDFSANLDQSRFKPFERHSNSTFRPDFRFGVYLSIWSS
ncbi:hypothetical protein F2Q69_00049595 [Brassica cretica]|uniref:Uncharacterized protein n=1 Tax=Brassica cretica TaxID=69181 RepID=A0A8S9PSI8_BRACR|nr:hypothetical protein F2Q69_00049595 [Brassica cretica]